MKTLNLTQENVEKFNRIFKNPDDLLALQTNGVISDLIPAYDLAEIGYDNGELNVATWATEYICDTLKKPPLPRNVTTANELLEWLVSDDNDVEFKKENIRFAQAAHSNEQIAKTANSTKELCETLTKINQDTSNINEQGKNVNNDANKLALLATKLKTTIEKFKLNN